MLKKILERCQNTLLKRGSGNISAVFIVLLLCGFMSFLEAILSFSLSISLCKREIQEALDTCLQRTAIGNYDSLKQDKNRQVILGEDFNSCLITISENLYLNDAGKYEFRMGRNQCLLLDEPQLQWEAESANELRICIEGEIKWGRYSQKIIVLDQAISSFQEKIGENE